jgi:hypothetical protein
MLIGLPVHAELTYEVSMKSPPYAGDRYRDPRGHVWVVQHIGPASPALREPPPEHPVWRVALVAGHPSYRIEPGESLHPIYLRVCGHAWAGNLDFEQGVGFGTVHQRVVDAGLVYGSSVHQRIAGGVVYGGPLWSWHYRVQNNLYVLRVGPHVTGPNHFREPVFERTWTDPPASDLELIENGLHEFQEGR